MKTKLLHLREVLRTGFWFLPLVMLLAAGSLALVLVHVDRSLDPGTESHIAWAYSGGPEGARSLLSTIAGSMITAASVTFSLASVAISIASQQYGSRVLRNFMRDRVTQALLGVFVATFVYCVLVVRTIRGSDFGGGFVPAVSVTGAMVLSLASLVLLIYFIHHVSSSIQASHIIRVISEEALDAIQHQYPGGSGVTTVDNAQLDEVRRRGSAAIAGEQGGYIQSIDLDALLSMARTNDVVMELAVKPGDHVLQGDVLVHAWGSRTLPKDCVADVMNAFRIDRARTPEQDIRYNFQQFADVIVRALSPGINDPFSAVNGIDEMTVVLLEMARHMGAETVRVDDTGALRLIAPAVCMSELLRDTLGHIALYGASDRFVMERVRRSLHALQGQSIRGEDTAGAVRELFLEFDRLEAAAK